MQTKIFWKWPRSVKNISIKQRKIMTKLENEKEKYLKTVKNLEDILKKEKTQEYRDAAIKRFELCFDVAWKLLKTVLEEEKTIICKSPNECFQQAYMQGFIKYSDLWMKMAKTRNESVYTYKEELAEALLRIGKIL